jgi:putative lipoprotein
MVTGTVTYRERMALPPNAVVEVQLRNVSLTDVQATVIASQTIVNPTQVPIAFQLQFDAGQIEPRYAYAISARIMAGDQLAFINDRAYLVLTHGHPNRVEMVLRRVGGNSGANVPGGSEQGDHDARVAAALDELGTDLQRSDGTWKQGTVSARYTALLRHELPVVILESRTHLVPGIVAVQFYFNEGRLARYEETSSQPAAALSKPGGGVQEVSLRLYFDGADHYVTGWKTVDGTPMQPKEHEVLSAAAQARLAQDRLKHPE